MLLNDLTEGLSPVLFHSTSIDAAGKIVASNRIRLTATFTNPSEEKMGAKNLFFLSTTRSKIGGYTLSKAYKKSVVLVLDGRKLSHNNTGSPVQYWSRSMINMDWKRDELEDRVYHDKPFIEDANKYIKEIHILITEDEPLNSDDRKALISIKRSNIKTFIYHDPKDFVLMNKSKATGLRNHSHVKGPRYKPDPYDVYSTRKQKRRRSSQNNNFEHSSDKWLAFLTWPLDQFEKFGYHEQRLLSRLDYDHLFREALSSLSVDLQNNRNNDKFMGKLARIMKKHGLRTGSDIMGYIRDRWKPVVNG